MEVANDEWDRSPITAANLVFSEAVDCNFLERVDYVGLNSLVSNLQVYYESMSNLSN